MPLIVEDNLLDLKLITQLIKSSFQCNIDTAKDGREAFSMLLKKKYNLVITDIIMPHIDGLELISKIKELNPSTTIIAVSSSKPFYLLLAKKTGIQAIFTKPLNKDKFLNTISKLLFHTQEKDYAF